MVGTYAAVEQETEKADRLFALIGRCLTSFRALEEGLQQIFEVALGMEVRTGPRIFSTANTVDAKIKLVSAALSDRPSLLWEWKEIAKDVKSAAELRNKVAHCFGRRTVIRENEGIVKFLGLKMSEFQIYRMVGGEQQIISEDELREIKTYIESTLHEVMLFNGRIWEELLAAVP